MKKNQCSNAALHVLWLCNIIIASSCAKSLLGVFLLHIKVKNSKRYAHNIVICILSIINVCILLEFQSTKWSSRVCAASVYKQTPMQQKYGVLFISTTFNTKMTLYKRDSYKMFNDSNSLMWLESIRLPWTNSPLINSVKLLINLHWFR